MSTHNICFDQEIRKISFTNALLYGGLEYKPNHRGHDFSFRSISPIIDYRCHNDTLLFLFQINNPDYRGHNDTLLFLFQINNPDYRGHNDTLLFLFQIDKPNYHGLNETLLFLFQTNKSDYRDYRGHNDTLLFLFQISLITDTNSQICDSTPYCFLPAYLPLPYYFSSVIGHAQCGLLTTNPTPNSYCKMPAPVSPSPYCCLSPTMSYGRDLQCPPTVGVPQGYTYSPIDYNCSTPTWASARSGDQKTMMRVPPMRHATRYTIAELSGAESRGDDDDSGEDSRLSFVDSSASDCS